MHPAHRRPWLIVLWLIVFFPVGLYLVWKASPWSPRGRWTATGITVGLFLIFGVAGAASPSPPTTSDAARPEAEASTAPQPTISATPPPRPSPPATPTKSARAAKPKVTRTPARPSHGALVLAGGIVLPNRALTPGATNPNVTQSSIPRTICLTGYTSTIRPSSSYPTS